MQWQILKTGLNSLCVTRRRDGKLQHLMTSHADLLAREAGTLKLERTFIGVYKNKVDV